MSIPFQLMFFLACFHLGCDEGTFGANCDGICHCTDGATCDPMTGLCSNSLCDMGWTGPNCQMTDVT